MTNEEWQKRLESLESLLVAKDKEIEFLKARIAELEKRLGLDSSTSSKPPSSDGLRKKSYMQSLRTKGKNPSGGQKGHKGHSLSQVEQPDEVVNHKVSTCPKCKRNIEEVATEGRIKRQVIDIPPMNVCVTEHQVEIKVCDHCQTRIVGEFPAGVNAPVQYGRRIKAMAVYLNHQQLIPEDRVQCFS